MNGAVIDISGITVNVNPIEMQDSSDVAHLITITDGDKLIEITILYGKIVDEKVCSNINKQ